MKTLIIGAGGFIGSHMRQALGVGDVVAVDVRACGQTMDHYLDTLQPDFDTLVGDVRPDLCVNCAGAANVAASFDNPHDDFQLNAYLVQGLLEALRKRSPRTKFINLSSAAVYGNPSALPISEDSKLQPISPYGFHKQVSETLCQSYARAFGLSTISVRPFSVYGPGLRKQLFWDIFQRSWGSDTLSCGGTGRETRDFIHVADACSAILACADHAKFEGEAINIANGSEVHIEDAIKALLTAVGWEGQLVFTGEAREGDPINWRADITKLKSFGYSPKFEFKAGIEEVAQWLKHQL